MSDHPSPVGALKLQTSRALDETADDAPLVRRAAAGDKAAFHQLYEEQFDFVLRNCMRFGLSESDAEDATQETFQIAHRKLDRFTQGRFSTWLYRIAANVVSDLHRRRRVREALLSFWGPREEPLAPGPDAAMNEADTTRQVGEVLARMTPKKREVFVLYELEELSGEEIAERVGVGVATVWTRLHYARQEFKKIAAERGLGTLAANEASDAPDDSGRGLGSERGNEP